MFQNITKEGDSLSFQLLNVKLALSNALRRIMIAELPMVAINQVDITTNTSMLHNYMLTKRLKLCPLSSKTAYDPEKIEITLDKKNENDYMIDILTEDFVTIYDGKKVENMFISGEILFGKLKPNQEVKLTAKVIESTKKAESTPEKATPEFSHICKSVVIFAEDNIRIEKEGIEGAETAKYYLKNDKGDPEIYNFDIETIGVWECSRIFETAIQVLKNKLETLLMKLNNDEINIKKTVNGYDFELVDEDDTLANLITQYLREDVKYVGYIIPHPLDPMVIVRMFLEKENTEEMNKQIFINAVIKISGIVDDLRKKWIYAASPKKKKIKIIKKEK